MDAVYVGQFAMVVTFDDVHVILHLISHGVGLLDAASTRGIITCYGQPDHRAVRQDERFLYQTFAKRAATYHQTAVLVLVWGFPWSRRSPICLILKSVSAARQTKAVNLF